MIDRGSSPEILRADQATNSDWEKVRNRLRQEVGDRTYGSWFKNLELQKIIDGRAYMTVSSKFVCDWIITHHEERLRRIWQEEAPTVSAIDVVAGQVGAEATGTEIKGKDRKTDKNGSEKNREQSNSLSTSQYDWICDGRSRPALNITFENFVVGRQNELAHAAAQRVAEYDDTSFNPLFLFGGVGLGKTHLLQAIAHQIRHRNPKRRVIYASAETFISEFLKSLRNKDTFRFKDKIRSADVLLLDDIQFIAEKGTTQEEFFHTFNSMKDNGSQLVIAADRSPSKLDGIEERLQSRLCWGLTAEIHPADFELRLGILRSKLNAEKERNPKFDVPIDVLEFLAERIKNNIRQLEGALSQLVAHSLFTGEQISLDVTHQVLRDLIEANDRSLTVAEIQENVAAFYKTTVANLVSGRRERLTARSRMIAMYLSSLLTNASYPQIGDAFGGRDHTTVLHAKKRIQNERELDSNLEEELETLSQMLSAKKAPKAELRKLRIRQPLVSDSMNPLDEVQGIDPMRAARVFLGR